MLQLSNSTAFATKMALFPNEQGIDSLYILARATFNIGQHWTLAEPQPEPEIEDIYWGEPNESSIRYASDFHSGKPSTDIIMVGNAYAPGLLAVRQLDASLAVGRVSKTVRIFGDRVWSNGRISAAKPFTSMPVVYEKAYGGKHIDNGDIVSIQEENPLGLGYVGSRSATEMEGKSLPNLEDPSQLISSLEDTPYPACFAISSGGWLPRVQYAGSYDDNWQMNTAPYLPDDFDSRFFNMAHKDLIYPGYLQGGEEVRIINMHKKGNLQFSIPVIKFLADIEINDRWEQTGFHMETLLLEPNQLRLSMTFKSSITTDRESLKIQQVKVRMGN